MVNILINKTNLIMKTLSIEKMENIEGGSVYCDNMWTVLTGGNFQGSNELYLSAWEAYAEHCVD